MAKTQDISNNDQYDIFISDAIYPNATAIFQTHTESLDSLKDICLVVLDTNVLLLPYSTGKESLQRIGETYKQLVDAKRLFVPGQVAREFAKNRAIKLTELFQQIVRKSNVPNLQKGKYPLLESLEEYQELIRLEQEIDEELAEYRKAVGKVTKHIRQWTWNDPVSLLYANLFTDNVVHDPDFDRQDIVADLNRRQLHNIPPGYKDASKDDHGIGDLLIWYTILELGKKHKKSVLFVTGDEKTDWFHQSEKQALYPRFELVDEFRRISEGESFHIISFSRFLDLYGVSEDIVQEVREQEIREQEIEEQLLQGQSSFVQRSVKYSGEAYLVEQLVYKWLQDKYPTAVIEYYDRTGKRGYGVDMEVLDDKVGLIAVEVKYFSHFTRVGQPNVSIAQLEAKSLKSTRNDHFDL